MIYSYTGFYGFPSLCELEIHHRDGFTIVIFTELANNPGTSINSNITQLATEVYTKRLAEIPIEAITFVEHYRWPDDEHFDAVTFDWNGLEFSHPQWKRIDPTTIGL